VSTVLAAIAAALLVAVAAARPPSIDRLKIVAAHLPAFRLPEVRRRADDQDAIRDFICVIIAELSVGRPVHDALRTARDEALPRERHQDITASSSDLWLRKVAIILEVSAQTGASAVPALEAVMAAMADSHRLERTIATELAAPRYTAALLAALPVFVWIVGGFIDASPLVWLFSSPVGIAVLLAGLSLNIAGLWSIHRIARSAAT
jgi:tight adherence protein B